MQTDIVCFSTKIQNSNGANAKCRRRPKIDSENLVNQKDVGKCRTILSLCGFMEMSTEPPTTGAEVIVINIVF